MKPIQKVRAVSATLGCALVAYGIITAGNPTWLTCSFLGALVITWATLVSFA